VLNEKCLRQRLPRQLADGGADLLSKQMPEAGYFNLQSRGLRIHWQEPTVRDLVGVERTTMDVTEQAQRIELEKAFEEIKLSAKSAARRNVVLREEIDQAFMFESSSASRSALQECFSANESCSTDSSVLVIERLECKNSSPAPS